MSQFRKKPVVVEASQWFKNGDHPLDYEKDVDNLFANVGSPAVYTAAYRCENNWEGDVVRYYRHPGVPGDKPCEQCGKPHQVHGWIDTLEQGHRVCPGDWIIMGVKGEMYPCKPDIFAATYEPAAAPPAPPAPLPGKESLTLSPPGNYIQTVPDHCDRIIWRGRYWALPIKSIDTPVSPALEAAPADYPPQSEIEAIAERLGATDPDDSLWRDFAHAAIDADRAQRSGVSADPLPRPLLTDLEIQGLRRQARNDPRCADQHWFILMVRAIESYYGVTGAAAQSQPLVAPSAASPDIPDARDAALEQAACLVECEYAADATQGRRLAQIAQHIRDLKKRGV